MTAGAWLLVGLLALWLVTSAAFILFVLWEWRTERRMDRHVSEAIALTQSKKHHPSAPIGPEDEPRWKEWAR